MEQAHETRVGALSFSQMTKGRYTWRRGVILAFFSYVRRTRLLADYYHPLTFCCFCGIMEEGILTDVTDYGRLLPKCQILLTNIENCGTIMVEEYTLVCGQTTRGGYLCAGGGHPDYYAYEAAGSRT